MYSLISVVESFPVTTQATHGKGQLMSCTFNIIFQSPLECRKLFSQFSAVFIDIKNRKETILIPTSVNFARHKVRLIVQVQKYCFLFGEVTGIFLSDCNNCENLATCHGQFISSYLFQLNKESLLSHAQKSKQIQRPFHLNSNYLVN